VADAARKEELKRKLSVPNSVLGFTKKVRLDLAAVPEDCSALSIADRLAMVNLVEAQLRLTKTVYDLSRGIMEDYASGVGAYGISASQAVKTLSEKFQGCKTPDEFEKRAFSFYTTVKELEEADAKAQFSTETFLRKLADAKEVKKTVEDARATLISWWKKLHDLHVLYDDQVPGLLKTFLEDPGSGRSVYHYKLMTALDVANWVVSMEMKFVDWKVSGKSVLYDWMEELLIKEGKLDRAFVF